MVFICLLHLLLVVYSINMNCSTESDVGIGQRMYDVTCDVICVSTNGIGGLSFEYKHV